jgi:hypothetical protein
MALCYIHQSLLLLLWRLFRREILSLSHEEAILLMRLLLVVVGEILGIRDRKHVILLLEHLVVVFDTQHALGVEALSIGKTGDFHLLQLQAHDFVLLLKPLYLAYMAGKLL